MWFRNVSSQNTGWIHSRADAMLLLSGEGILATMEWPDNNDNSILKHSLRSSSWINAHRKSPHLFPHGPASRYGWQQLAAALLYPLTLTIKKNNTRTEGEGDVTEGQHTYHTDRHEKRKSVMTIYWYTTTLHLVCI